MAEKKNAKYIVTELKWPVSNPEFEEAYAKWAKRLLFMSNNVVEGAFNVMCSWYLGIPPEPLAAHSHDNGEIIAFFGSNPEDPYNLNGEIEFWLEDERFDLTRSCIIYVPGGMKHCPMVIKRVDKPILHMGASVK